MTTALKTPSFKMMTACALVIGGLAVSGCATKDYGNTQVGGVQSQVTRQGVQLGN